MAVELQETIHRDRRGPRSGDDMPGQGRIDQIGRHAQVFTASQNLDRQRLVSRRIKPGRRLVYRPHQTTHAVFVLRGPLMARGKHLLRRELPDIAARHHQLGHIILHGHTAPGLAHPEGIDKPVRDCIRHTHRRHGDFLDLEVGRLRGPIGQQQPVHGIVERDTHTQRFGTARAEPRQQCSRVPKAHVLQCGSNRVRDPEHRAVHG